MAVITGAILAGVAVAGQVMQYSAQKKSQKYEQRMANVQNSRERKQALRAMRVQQRALEASGVASGTVGSSAAAGADASAASSTAGGLGYQSAMIANAQEVSHWNNMASGYGALSSVAGSLSTYTPSFASAIKKAKTT